jgi:hypothetical protein
VKYYVFANFIALCRAINFTNGWFPLIAAFSITRRGGARYLAKSKILSKILRIEMKNYSHHLDNGNILNQTSMDKGPFITKLLDEI